MSEIYNIRLKKEFELLQQLEHHPFNRNGIIRTSYMDRITGGFKSVSENPSGGLYPNRFRVKYTFPIMYVGPGQVEHNWSHSFSFDVSEANLLGEGSFDLVIDNGGFQDGHIPYNSHIQKAWFCIGSQWESSKGLGIWYFVVSIGAVLNQDKCEMNIHETVHANSEAFDYWVHDRNMQPNNDIDWPFNMVDDLSDEESNSIFKVKFVDDNGRLITEQSLPTGTRIQVPISPRKPGYSFTGWNPPVPGVVGNSDMVFTAQYTSNVIPQSESSKPKITIVPKGTGSSSGTPSKPKFSITPKNNGGTSNTIASKPKITIVPKGNNQINGSNNQSTGGTGGAKPKITITKK